MKFNSCFPKSHQVKSGSEEDSGNGVKRTLHPTTPPRDDLIPRDFPSPLSFVYLPGVGVGGAQGNRRCCTYVCRVRKGLIRGLETGRPLLGSPEMQSSSTTPPFSFLQH